MSSINIHFKNSDFRATKAGNSGAMKKIMEHSSAKKALKYKSQQQAFYDSLKKNKDPRHMDKALKETLGEFLVNNDDKITTRDVREMGKEFVKHGKRFIVPKKEMRAHGMERRSSGLARTSPRISGIMDRRIHSSDQAPKTISRTPLINDNGMRSKLGGLSPSFGVSSAKGSARPGIGTAAPTRHQ